MQQTLNLWIEGSNPSGGTKYPWLNGLGSGLQHRLWGFDSLRILQHTSIVQRRERENTNLQIRVQFLMGVPIIFKEDIDMYLDTRNNNKVIIVKDGSKTAIVKNLKDGKDILWINDIYER